MPVLPSGRRVEFSLDRFHALLRRVGRHEARRITENLQFPDDLLFVLDAVHFRLSDGRPYFADYVAAHWQPYAAEWSNADREALRAWLTSDSARLVRDEAIDYIKAISCNQPGRPVRYPYVTTSASHHGFVHEGSMLRQ